MRPRSPPTNWPKQRRQQTAEEECCHCREDQEKRGRHGEDQEQRSGHGEDQERRVTGPKLNLATIGKVPSAANADNAGNANTVGGNSVQKVFAKIPANGSTTLGTFSAFKINATCDGAGNVEIVVDPQATDTDYAAAGNGQPKGAFFAREFGIEPNQAVISGENDRGFVSFSGSQTGGPVVSGSLGWDDTPSFDNEPVCSVYGHVVISG